MARHDPPVRYVQHDDDDGVPLATERLPGDCDVHRVRGQHDEERGQQAKGAAPVEGAERQSAGSAVLPDEQGSNQETAEHEEHVDAEKGTRQYLPVLGRVEHQNRVIGHDQEHRDTA